MVINEKLTRKPQKSGAAPPGKAMQPRLGPGNGDLVTFEDGVQWGRHVRACVQRAGWHMAS